MVLNKTIQTNSNKIYERKSFESIKKKKATSSNYWAAQIFIIITPTKNYFEVEYYDKRENKVFESLNEARDSLR